MNNYEIYEADKLTKEVLDSVKVGDLVKCNEWKQPLIVKVTSENFFIMARNVFGKTLYSICEKRPSEYSRNYFTKGSFMIGTDNLIFGIYDYLKQDDCEEAIKELENGNLALSHRKTVDLMSIQIKRA